MTPRDFRVLAVAKIAQLKDDQMFRDKLNAYTLARMINMHCGTKENPRPVLPENCMAFQWGEQKEIISEMTEEDMENFDRCMETHRGNHHG